MKSKLGLHETMELHELLVFKNLSLTKSLLMSGMVQDEELKTILSDDANTGAGFIQNMKEILTEGRSQA
jgi:similar to spore coat protein